MAKEVSSPKSDLEKFRVKEAEKEVYGPRVLVISPYKPLNDLLCTTINAEIKGSNIDKVEHAKLDHEPYILVENNKEGAGREEGRQLPFLIIDFGKIISDLETKVLVVEFSGYRDWSKGFPINYLSPSEEFSKMLKRRESYDPKGNFLPGSFSIKEFGKRLRHDISLFYKQKGKSGYEKHLDLLRVRPRNFR